MEPEVADSCQEILLRPAFESFRVQKISTSIFKKGTLFIAGHTVKCFKRWDLR